MVYRTYDTTAYTNVYSTGTAADGNVTHHQVGERGGRYYRRRLNVNGRHKAVSEAAEQVDIETGLRLALGADDW